MSRLLYIQASCRGERSKSMKAANGFVKAYKQAHPQDEVKTINVFDSQLPSFDGFAVQAKYNIMHGTSHSPEQQKAWRKIENVIEEFKSADKYVFAIPMWNFSIPYRLKQYIDILVQPGYTFSFDSKTGYSGLVKGKPVMAVYARGGEYRPGTAAESFDVQKKYFELILGFIGFEKIESIIIEPTLQGGPQVADVKCAEAIEKAKKIAANF